LAAAEQVELSPKRKVEVGRVVVGLQDEAMYGGEQTL